MEALEKQYVADLHWLAMPEPVRAATVRERAHSYRPLDAPSQSRLGAIETLGVLWCNLMHDAPMWPMHGTYQCRECGRSYPVPWAGEQMLRQAPANKPAQLALKHQ